MTRSMSLPKNFLHRMQKFHIPYGKREIFEHYINQVALMASTLSSQSRRTIGTLWSVW